MKWKIVHFDCYPDERKYQKKEGHGYFQENIQEYLSSHGEFSADIVTGFVYSKFTKEILQKIKNLKFVVTRSIGLDNIDTEYCYANNIKFTNVDYSSHNVAHHTIALILFYTRQLCSFYGKVQKGNFCDKEISCYDLKGKKLGIIGYGRIGKEVAKIANSFGLEVLIYDRKLDKCEIRNGEKFCGLDKVLKNSDIISLHCDANPTSIGMINTQAIKKMKEGVILINTARGSIINDKDLLRNIRKFSFVGLDVLEDENLFRKSHPFLKYPNVFITPHIGYKSELTTQERWKQTYAHIDEFISQQKS